MMVRILIFSFISCFVVIRHWCFALSKPAKAKTVNVKQPVKLINDQSQEHDFSIRNPFAAINPSFGQIKQCYVQKPVSKAKAKEDSHRNAVQAEAYRRQLIKKARLQGISSATANKLMMAKVLERVITLDRRQTSNITFDDYVDFRLKKLGEPGIDKMNQNLQLLQSMEDVFGVDRELLVATWGMETIFGTFVGKNRAIDALFSLALEGRRRGLFETELIEFLRLVDRGSLPWDVISSYDGGIGQCQFMPSSIRKYAVGYRRKKLDLLCLPSIALASISNYYSHKVWRLREPVMTTVKIPDGFDLCLIGVKEPRTIEEWLKLGIKFAPGGIGREALQQKKRMAYLIVPGSSGGDFNPKDKAFLFYDNAMAIYKWNMSSKFVVTTAHLMDLYKKKAKVNKAKRYTSR